MILHAPFSHTTIQQPLEHSKAISAMDTVERISRIHG